ncbi:MAG: GNAT family N-acetyltransferase [Solirubrobacteraceae bacterium]
MNRIGRSQAVYLRDESQIILRPIAPEDKELLLAAFDRLSETSRYRRFFSYMQSLGERQLAYLTEVDHHDHEAIIAIDAATGDAVGIGRYIRLAPDADIAEVAIVVIDDWHGRGVARAVLRRLASRARREGIRRFTAEVKVENPIAISVLRGVGHTELRRDGTEIHMVIDLPKRGIGAKLRRALRAAAAGWLSAADATARRLAPGGLDAGAEDFAPASSDPLGPGGLDADAGDFAPASSDPLGPGGLDADAGDSAPTSSGLRAADPIGDQ